jgi:DNA-binding IclR family transcriptional regulator
MSMLAVLRHITAAPNEIHRAGDIIAATGIGREGVYSALCGLETMGVVRVDVSFSKNGSRAGLCGWVLMCGYDR